MDEIRGDVYGEDFNDNPFNDNKNICRRGNSPKNYRLGL